MSAARTTMPGASTRGAGASFTACRRLTWLPPTATRFSSNRSHRLRVPLIFAGLAWVLYFVPGVFGAYGIFIDELYYVSCAKRLAWGYVDHPPLAPFLLRGALAIFGDSIVALRVPAATCRRAGRLAHRMDRWTARRFAIRTGDSVRRGRVVAAAAGAVRVLLDERHRAGVVAGVGRSLSSKSNAATMGAGG